MATLEGVRVVSDPAPLADKSPQIPRHRRSGTLWLLGIGGVLVVLVPLFMTEAVWDGHFPLTLDVRSESGKAIKALSYATFFKNEQAQWWLTKRPEGQPDWGFRPAVQNGGRFVADGDCSGRLWGVFKIERNYVESRYIVIRATYEDGQETRRLAEIPAGRGPRSLTLVIP